jgi:hypothetical protein
LLNSGFDICDVDGQKMTMETDRHRGSELRNSYLEIGEADRSMDIQFEMATLVQSGQSLFIQRKSNIIISPASDAIQRAQTQVAYNGIPLVI